MNICILNKSTLAHQMGGMEVHLDTLSESAVKLGHSVSVVTTRHPEAIGYEEKYGASFHYLINTRSARYTKSWWEESTKKILQLHNKNKFNVIWAQSFSGYYYACKVKSSINVPIISIMQCEGIIGVIKSGWNSISSLKEAFDFMIKYLPESIFLTLPLFRGTLKYSDAIVAVSNETAKSIQREFFIQPEKIFVIYNAVNTDIFRPDGIERKAIRNKYSLNDETKVILMAGVLHQQKGMDIGLKAFAQIKKKVPKSKMMIVGDGPQLASLKKLAKKLNTENDVIFCGFIPNEKVHFYYNAADLFLNPTLKAEGLPFVIIEAMACALPVITTGVGGTPSTIDEGISGFFVNPKDEKALAQKSIKVLMDKGLSERFGKNARAKAVAQFSKEKMIADYLSVSQELITKR